MCNLNRINCNTFNRVYNETDCGSATDKAKCEADSLAKFGSANVTGFLRELSEVVKCHNKPWTGVPEAEDVEVRKYYSAFRGRLCKSRGNNWIIMGREAVREFPAYSLSI